MCGGTKINLCFNFRLFEDKVYLAVLSKGINIKKNKYAYENGADENIETKISMKVSVDV